MFKGPKGPVSGQTPRTIAEKVNDSGNFTEGPAYDAQTGLPSSIPTGGKYKALDLKPNTSAKPMDIPAPFTVKQG